MKILSNQVECLKCGDKPFSAHQHHFATCKCGAVSVDGGSAYLRRLGEVSNYKELSISVSDRVVELMTDEVTRAIDSGRNPLGVVCAALRGLRDSEAESERVGGALEIKTKG